MGFVFFRWDLLGVVVFVLRVGRCFVLGFAFCWGGGQRGRGFVGTGAGLFFHWRTGRFSVFVFYLLQGGLVFGEIQAISQ